jgi:hypothetical protein
LTVQRGIRRDAQTEDPVEGVVRLLGPASGPGTGQADLVPGRAAGELGIRLAQPLEGLDITLHLLGGGGQGVGLESGELGQAGR